MIIGKPLELLEIIWYVPSRPVPGYSYGYRIPGIPKKSELKCYSENAILSSGAAARNQFLPVQSDTFGCAEKALKMLIFDVGASQSGITYRRINPYGWVPVGSNGRHLASLYYKKPTVSSSSRNARNKKEVPTIHPHHCSKIQFQNEDSHSKKFRVIIIIKIPVGQSQPTVRQSVSAAVGTLETKIKKLRRFNLITAVKFYSKMKTPTQKHLG